MAKFNFQVSKTSGKAPGTVVYLGEKEVRPPKITVLNYNPDKCEFEQITSVEELARFRDDPAVTWINIDGISHVETIEKIGEIFGLHPLLLEDIVDTNQRPKYEEFDNGIFLVLKMLTFNEKTQLVEAEHLSLVLGKNFVISFQEHEGDVFENIRYRIKETKWRIRKLGADYLAYALTDAVVDNYFAILERLGENIETVEEQIVKAADDNIQRRIYLLKRELIMLRKSVWPLREVINSMQKNESKMITKTTNLFLRDLYDHTIQTIDTIETMRDILTGMLDIYMSVVSNRMNSIMKVLTIIATIFIPLTFIAGVYGMNFDDMPELHQKWGYPAVLALMAAVTIGMLLFFRRKKWI
ncbi:MAG: magnesium/cobalt transporter CorA [Phycisphaerae bacterium]|nr:magnesium/cobalt transporter CorA [Phycisphaerae bacterium]